MLMLLSICSTTCMTFKGAKTSTFRAIRAYFNLEHSTFVILLVSGSGRVQHCNYDHESQHLQTSNQSVAITYNYSALQNCNMYRHSKHIFAEHHTGDDASSSAGGIMYSWPCQAPTSNRKQHAFVVLHACSWFSANLSGTVKTITEVCSIL